MLNQDEKKRLWTLIEPIKTAMMTTWNGETLHARPMQHLNDHFDGTLMFFTDIKSGKINESLKNNTVCLSYSEPKTATYVSMSGSINLVQDRSLIEQHWNSFAEAWFPKGKEDPKLAIMRVHIHLAEFWDGPSNRMVQLFKLAEAKVKNKRPDMGENEKLGH